jgi:hypothetical protein
MTPLVPPQWCKMTPLVPHQRIQLCKLSHRTSGVNDTTGAASAVLLTTLVQNDTAGAGEQEFERLWLPLKGISIKKLHRQIVLPYSNNNHTKNIGVN